MKQFPTFIFTGVLNFALLSVVLWLMEISVKLQDNILAEHCQLILHGLFFYIYIYTMYSGSSYNKTLMAKSHCFQIEISHTPHFKWNRIQTLYWFCF